jgi:uncharacterized protein YidB (DUF937 family)
VGLFDQLGGLGGLIGQLGGGHQRNTLLDLAARLVQDQPGGLAGLVERFNQAGLGEQVKSWVGVGENLPISTDQLTAALGRANLEGMGERLGVGAQTITAGLATLLPHLIDQLTPRGQVQQDQDLTGTLTSLLRQLKG